MIHHQSRKAIILQSRGEGAPDRSCGEKRMAPPRRIVETASRRPQHSCSLQLLLPLIVRCWCLRRRLESSAAAAASASASPSWLSVQAQLSELHISGQERTCFALTPSPSRSSQNFRNMPATKLWKVLAFRLVFFPLLLAQANLAIITQQQKNNNEQQEGAANNPLGPVHCIPLLHGMNIHLPEGCGGKKERRNMISHGHLQPLS